MKTFLFYLIQWTWGLPVNLVGGIIFLICKAMGRRSEKFEHAWITYLPWNQGGLSMGLFIFMKENHPNETWTYNTRIHEYGHTWQCLLLGVFYYPVIAIPSSIWCNFFEGWRRKHHKSYYIFYPEKWANAWGQKFSGMRMTDINPDKERAAKPVQKSQT